VDVSDGQPTACPHVAVARIWAEWLMVRLYVRPTSCGEVLTLRACLLAIFKAASPECGQIQLSISRNGLQTQPLSPRSFGWVIAHLQDG
jgi:hypothetical protein